MKVPLSKALDISGSPYLIIGSLLRVECADLDFHVGWLR